MSIRKERTCQVCEKNFIGTHSGRRGNLVCSPECRIESIRLSKLKGREVECYWCGLLHWRAPYDLARATRYFCSGDCRKSEHNSRHVSLSCEYCEKVCDMPRSLAPTFKYCSLDCRALAERDRVTLVCKICDAPFEVIPSHIDRYATCSPECRQRYLLSVIVPQMPRHGTKPELMFEEFAGERVKRTSDGTFFVTFKTGRVKNPDFVVRPFQERKVVEVFGDYWHPREEEAELVQLYQDAGYHCLILWEHEMYDGSFRDKFLRFFGC